jgi:hypothetical protein
MYLHEHPQVFMSPVKEPQFFTHLPPGMVHSSLARNLVETREAYEALFAEAAGSLARGESSTSYLYNSTGEAERIRALLPHAKLVAVLRNPVERAFSAWALFHGRALEPLAFEAAIQAELDGQALPSGVPRRYLKLGGYATQLQGWDRHFPREQLRVWLYEDFISDPRSTLASIFAFIGVDPSFVPNLSRRYNERPHITKRQWLHERLSRGAHRLRLRNLLGRSVYRGAARWWKRLDSADERTVSPEAVRRLYVHFRGEVEALELRLNRDLSTWKGTAR